MSKKKKKKRIKFFKSHQYNNSESTVPSRDGISLHSVSGTGSILPSRTGTAVKPLAVVGGNKDSHGPAVLPFDSAPQLYPADVRVFVGDPPLYMHSIPEWQARDAISRGEATVLRTTAKIRGIRLSPKFIRRLREQRDHESRQGSSLATLDQVEGIPVVGPAIRLFYTGKQKAKPDLSRGQKWKKAA